MFDVKNNMLQILKPLLIYNIEPQSITDLEISTYSHPLQITNDLINNLLNESFIQTAKDYGLKSKIQLLSLNIDDNDSISYKRQKILNTLATNSNNFNKQYIIDFLKSLGYDCTLTENIKEESITISFKDKKFKPKNISSFKTLVLKIAPAHLDVIFDIEKEDTVVNPITSTSQEISWDYIN